MVWAMLMFIIQAPPIVWCFFSIAWFPCCLFTWKLSFVTWRNFTFAVFAICDTYSMPAEDDIKHYQCYITIAVFLTCSFQSLRWWNPIQITRINKSAHIFGLFKSYHFDKTHGPVPCFRIHMMSFDFIHAAMDSKVNDLQCTVSLKLAGDWRGISFDGAFHL